MKGIPLHIYIPTYSFYLLQRYCRDAVQKPNVPEHIFYVATFCILWHYAGNNVLLYTIYFNVRTYFCAHASVLFYTIHFIVIFMATRRVPSIYIVGHSTFDLTGMNELFHTIHFNVLVPDCLDYTDYRCILFLPFVKKMYLN